MRSAKEYRSQLAALVKKSNAITTAWEGKEEDEGFEEAMTELRSILGKADEIKVMLEMANQKEGLDKLIAEPNAATIGASASFTMDRETAPGEGVVPEGQREAIATHSYKSAYESYLRRDLDQMGPNDVKTLQEGQDDAGGFLVPEDWRANLLKRTAARPNIRQNAQVITTSRDSVRMPKVVYAGDYRYTSGVRMKWVGETPAAASEHRVTDPVFGSELIQIYTGMASLPITLDLLEDAAFPIEGYITEILGEAFDLGEESVWVSGTGAGQPQGILTHPQIAVLSADTGNGMHVISGHASLLTADGIISVGMQLPEQYDINAKWYFNKRSVEQAIRKLKDSDNNYLWPVWPQVGGFGPHNLELLGYPVVRTPFMPNIAANAYPILFGDMRGYTIVDRIGLSIQRLRELYAETNLVVFLARKRVGGKLMETYRLQAQKVSA
jgi:HK97 family phage major capsid protein